MDRHGGFVEPERRQITVLFCDMVNSTRLAESLDPEDMRELLGRYQLICGQVTAHHTGTVTRYVGDGIRTLFGYPKASEHASEHAVRAGLEIVRTLDQEQFITADGQSIDVSVRIGIATGDVVVGDLIREGVSEKEAIVGSTPNLAARLQSIAEPGTVVIAPLTRTLTGTLFRYENLGESLLKGYTQPIQAWQVIEEVEGQSRFEATRKELTPFVNRVEHMEFLLNKFQLAKSGHGQLVVLSGEAGIGKSRIVQELHERLPKGSHIRLRYQCSPLHKNTALFPFSSYLQRVAGFEGADTLRVRREKLAALFQPDQHLDDESLNLFTNMLGISEERPRTAQTDSTQWKQHVFNLIAGQYAELSKRGCVLFVVEDLHWADPTTRELLSFLIDRLAQLPILLVTTARSSSDTVDWEGRYYTSSVKLERLNENDTHTIIRHVMGETELTSGLVQELINRADGVPLFTEELSRSTMLSTDTLERGPAVPATLKDSLMERLDQLATPRYVVQIASVIGREFKVELLAHLIDLPLDELHKALRHLEKAGIIYRREHASPGQYTFKHALVQDAAYASMLRRLRRQIHHKVARYYEASLKSSPIKYYELVAHHFAAAAEHSQAVDYWLKAGILAAERSLNVEAVEHFQSGLTALMRLPYSQARDCQELTLLVNLGPRLLVTRGPGSQEVSNAYSKALKLCDRTPNSADHFAALWNWWRIAPNLEAYQSRAERLSEVANQLSDPGLRLQAHHCHWATAFNMGDLQDCCDQIEQGLALYDPELHRNHALIYGGHDPKVCALGEQALALWLMGYQDQGFAALQAMERWAESIEHMGSDLHAMEANINFYRYAREYPLLMSHAAKMIKFAEARSFTDYATKGYIFQGLAQAHLGDIGAGLKQVQHAIEVQKSSGTKEDFPVYFEILAELFAMAGQPEEGLPLLVDIYTSEQADSARYWSAELCRRRGELLAMVGQRQDARCSFNESIAIAEKQQARSLLLRALMSLVRLEQANNYPGGAIQRLQHELSLFSEGHKGRDLGEALQLVELYGH